MSHNTLVAVLTSLLCILIIGAALLGATSTGRITDIRWGSEASHWYALGFGYLFLVVTAGAYWWKR